MAVSDIRYARLGHVILNVTDLARSAEFYESKLGLQHAPIAHDGLAFFRCSERRQDIVLAQAAAPGLKRVGWQMESAKALAAVREELTRLGIAVHDISNADRATFGIGEAFRATEPTTGAVFEFYVDMDAGDRPYVPTHTKIARLGHIVFHSPDRAATERFMTDHLNFRVSDRIEETVSFMRCFPNPFHHSFGVGQTGRAGLNHVNFMVTDIDDIGRGLNRVKRENIPIVYGPGRHPPSESVFLYFLDPDGLTVEYSYGMEEFPEVGAREPRLLPKGLDSIDYWGGIPDVKFAKIGNFEPEAAA